MLSGALVAPLARLPASRRAWQSAIARFNVRSKAMRGRGWYQQLKAHPKEPQSGRPLRNRQSRWAGRSPRGWHDAGRRQPHRKPIVESEASPPRLLFSGPWRLAPASQPPRSRALRQSPPPRLNRRPHPIHSTPLQNIKGTCSVQT